MSGPKHTLQEKHKQQALIKAERNLAHALQPWHGMMFVKPVMPGVLQAGVAAE
jgi:hypothetical protein